MCNYRSKDKKFIATVIVPALIGAGLLGQTVAAEGNSVYSGNSDTPTACEIQSYGQYAYEDSDGTTKVNLDTDDLKMMAERMDKEAQVRNTADTNLTNALNAEKAEREEAITELGNQVVEDITPKLNAVQSNLETETTARQQADTALLQQVSDTIAPQVATLTSGLSAETTARTTKDTELTDKVTSLQSEVTVLGESVSSGKYTLATTIKAKGGTDLSSKFAKDANGKYIKTATYAELQAAVNAIQVNYVVNDAVSGKVTYTYHYHVDASGKKVGNVTTCATAGGCFNKAHYYYTETYYVAAYSSTKPGYSVYVAGYSYYSAGDFWQEWSGYYGYSEGWYAGGTQYKAAYTYYVAPVTTYIAAVKTSSAGNGYSVPEASGAKTYTLNSTEYELTCGRTDGEITAANITY